MNMSNSEIEKYKNDINIFLRAKQVKGLETVIGPSIWPNG